MPYFGIISKLDDSHLIPRFFIRPQQQSNALELAKLLLAQSQTAPNLLPVLAQLLSTASAPPAPATPSYPASNTNSSAALLPILASILGAASVTPQAQSASNTNHIAAAPFLNQMATQTSQMPSTSMALPQMSNAPTYSNNTSQFSNGAPPTFLETNSQVKNQNSANPFINQLKSVYDMHVSSLGQSLQPSSAHGQLTNQPPAIASKPAAKVPPVSVPVHSAAPSSLPERQPWQESNSESTSDGSILVGFLSSLKESYLKALHTPDRDNVGKGPRVTIGESATRVATVTDTSSVSQHGSSTEEVDWNPHRRVDADDDKRKMGGSSRGPPRKRHKQKQQARRD